MSQYDVGVIGAGPGGYVAAIRAAQHGAKVCLVEKDRLGGTCLNVGCIPSKALLHAAEVFHEAGNGNEIGITATDLSLDLGKVIDRKDKVLATLRGGVAALLKKNKVDVLQGTGRLLDANTVEVTGPDGATQGVAVKNVILATGSTPREISAFPFDGKRIVSSTEMLSLREVPPRLLIVGGGVIGCEFASMYGDFGSQVTVVEMLERLLPPLDPDLGEGMARVFKRRKTAVHTGAKVESLRAADAGVRAELGDGTIVEADVALVAVGRQLQSNGLGLEEAGVTVDRGSVPVDERCRTNLENIYAIGDVTGRIQLAHLASRMGLVAAAGATGHEAAVPFGIVPWGIFTRPQIGSVGLTEPEARDAGKAVKVAKYPMRSLGVAHAYGQVEGFVKLIAEEQTGEILGLHAMGTHTTEMVHEAAVAMTSEATMDELAETIHSHPTFSEAIAEAAEAWFGLPVHG